MKAEEIHRKLRDLPAIDSVLQQVEIIKLIDQYGHESITKVIRKVINHQREMILKRKESPDLNRIIQKVKDQVSLMYSPTLKQVLNATGVIIHSNLGRAPIGKKILKEITTVIHDYSNLEFDLKKGIRGQRNDHVIPLLTFITGAEHALVVNNNAAALILALHTLSLNREVIISRGELVEIGGSFRIPEILAASGAIMKEVGTTNKTHLADYEKAINSKTALILKVHKSNYAIQGFSQEVSLKELVGLAHAKGLKVLYDIGSGLLRKPAGLPLEDEPDVKSAINQGADMVTFSGDKLLGGPQSGLIVGKKDLVSRLSTAPMMRALRVDKLTLSILSTILRYYLQDNTMKESIPVFSILEQTRQGLKYKADELLSKLKNLGINARIVDSEGQCGGGTLPTLKIKSYAVVLISEYQSQKQRSQFAEKIYRGLLNRELPILAVLRKGEIIFDMLALAREDFSYIAFSIYQVAAQQEGS
jgi:L-seryl-tRNA(Ser) seleniumtransferase